MRVRDIQRMESADVAKRVVHLKTDKTGCQFMSIRGYPGYLKSSHDQNGSLTLAESSTIGMVVAHPQMYRTWVVEWDSKNKDLKIAKLGVHNPNVNIHLQTNRLGYIEMFDLVYL